MGRKQKKKFTLPDEALAQSGCRKWRYFLLSVLFLFLIIQYISLPNVNYLRKQNPKTTALMKLRIKQALAKKKIPKRNQIWIPYSQISPYLRSAVIVAEDAKFELHNGIDYQALWDALIQDITSFSFRHGGSTITMQLAKNLYLSPRKTLLRKFKELIIAKRLERELSKARILEIYLNIIEWGDGIYGCEAASQVYFKKPCINLTPEEAAMLAASIPNPRYINPSRNLQPLQGRTQAILYYMRKRGV